MSATDRAFGGSIPAFYDRYMVPMFFAPYAPALAERVARTGGRRFLETAAGTGVLTRALLAVLPPEAELIASDLNAPMVAHGTERTADRRVRWIVADAQALPFDDGAFDVVVSQFGVMFFPEQSRAFREALRVLRPGGSFIFSVWDDLAHNEIAATVDAAVAAQFPHDPPHFMARTPHGHFNVATHDRRLRDAGFTVVDVEAIDARSRATAQDAALALCHGTPLRNEIVARAPDGLDAITEAACSALVARFGDGTIDAAMRAFIISAR
jgi:SAM-dependent methyltransferase